MRKSKVLSVVLAMTMVVSMGSVAAFAGATTNIGTTPLTQITASSFENMVDTTIDTDVSDPQEAASYGDKVTNAVAPDGVAQKYEAAPVGGVNILNGSVVDYVYSRTTYTGSIDGVAYSSQSYDGINGTATPMSSTDEAKTVTLTTQIIPFSLFRLDGDTAMTFGNMVPEQKKVIDAPVITVHSNRDWDITVTPTEFKDTEGKVLPPQDLEFTYNISDDTAVNGDQSAGNQTKNFSSNPTVLGIAPTGTNGANDLDWSYHSIAIRKDTGALDPANFSSMNDLGIYTINCKFGLVIRWEDYATKDSDSYNTTITYTMNNV